MRLIQNMSTIVEFPNPGPDCRLANRVIKIAVLGGSGVGKTGKYRLSVPLKQYLYVFTEALKSRKVR